MFSEKLKPSFFTAHSGKISARLMFEDGTVAHHIHSTINPEREGSYHKAIEFWGDIIVFLGTGCGYQIVPFLNNIPPESIIILVDCYNEFLEYTAEIFKNLPNKVIQCSSVSEVEQLNTSDFGKRTTLQFIHHAASVIVNKNFYDTVANRLTKNLTCKKNISTKKSVLLMNGTFFLEKEIKNALTALGVEVLTFDYRGAGKKSVQSKGPFSRIVQQDRPDFLFSVNMMGFDGEGTIIESAGAAGMGIVVWFVDDPHPILLTHKKFINPSMVALCWEKKYIPFLEKCGFGKVIYCPLATDTTLFTFEPSNTPLCKISFLGTSMGSEFLNSIKSKFLWYDELSELVEMAAEMIAQNPGDVISELIRGILLREARVLRFNDERNLTWLYSLIIHTASYRKRVHYVKGLLRDGLEIFGDPNGWHDALGGKIVVHPSVDYHTGASSVYRNSLINLNITSSQMPTAVNQRVFDIPASGAMVISDHQKDLLDLFEPDEIVTYQNLGELREKCFYYAANHDERMAVIKKAYNRIRSTHTYIHRLQFILDQIKTIF